MGHRPLQIGLGHHAEVNLIKAQSTQCGLFSSSHDLFLPQTSRSPRKYTVEAKIGRLVGAVGDFFSGGDNVPWCDCDVIAGCEREVAEVATEEHKNEGIVRLSWALVHSRNMDDVNRGIAMLQASLGGSKSPLEAREKLYLLAVGHYRNGDYPRSRQLLEHCLEIQPGWGQALSLKKTVEDKIAKDGAIGIGIATTAVGLLVGIAAAVARKS